MKVFIVTPSFAIHGGIRIILEWANRLSDFHEVHLYSQAKDHCTWFQLNPKVKTTQQPGMAGMDCLIITSPHNIDFQDHPTCPDKVFIFAQMAEHLFFDTNDKDFPDWYNQCIKFYTSKHLMISISKWNMRKFRDFGRTTNTFYVDNGVNFEHFPISHKKKDGITVLVEGWECTNPSKDIDNIGPKVAARLKKEGFKVIAYSQRKLKTMPEALDEYYYKPSLDTMNSLYERATILIKATKYDARSCSPVEAMTKGTVTVRAIIEGDDDLIDRDNCVRVDYDEDELFHAAAGLLSSPLELDRLSKICRIWVQEHCDWDKKIKVINDIISW